jgi:hypothetical protein
MGSSSVRQLIIRVPDQLRAGEIRLIDATPEESAAAKLRLDEHREKRRERNLKPKTDQAERQTKAGVVSVALGTK